MGKNLFDDNSENEAEWVQLNTNKDYAKSYNKLRQKELLKKLKDRDLDLSDSDSSSESEYSEEELVNNPKFDQEFLKTLSSLKKKDPKIYDKNTKFFADVDIDIGPKLKDSNDKPLTLKDYERKVILEKGGQFEDDDSDETEGKRQRYPLSYAEEQQKLREEFRQALNSDESDDEEFGKIFKKREKTKEEKEREEEQYIEWLAGKKEDIAADAKETLKPLKQYWNKKDLPKQERFLRDYILNNGYIDKVGDEIPTYDEIVGDENLSEDEKELEKQAEFEQKFNFRFEEPDKDFIKRYPRTIENSVRIKDEKRKKKREEIKDRKLKEKEEKYKEIEILKDLKRKEIAEKIQKLKEVTGNEQLPFQEDDLEEEFDPVEHDKRMREIFNDGYYEVDEGEKKPECPDIEELKIEDWDNFDPQKDEEDDERYNYEPHCEDEDFNMDCDYDPSSKQDLQDEMIENTKDKRKRRKRRNRFMEMIKTEKPVFNPEDEKTYGEYIDEYYKMDCEDIVADLPCRFKYVETIPNDFGLTIEEILLAKTKELNQWASLKKAVQYRSEHEEKKDARIYKLKAKNEALKRKIFVSLYGPPSEDENENNENGKSDIEAKSCKATVTETKKEKRKKRKSEKVVANETTVNPFKLHDKSVKANRVQYPMPSIEQNSVNNSEVKLQSKERKKKNLKGVSGDFQLVEHENLQRNNKKLIKKLTSKEGKDKESTTKFSTDIVNEKLDSQVVVNGKVQKKVKKLNKKLKSKEGKDKKSTTKSSADISNERLDSQAVENGKVQKKVKKLTKKLKSKEGKDKKSTAKSSIDINNERLDSQVVENRKVQKKSKKLSNKLKSKECTDISDERLKAYGINPRKFHKKQKYLKIMKNKNQTNRKVS